jgi:hypothetical protein
MLMVFHERDWLGTTDIATILGLSGAAISPNSSAPLSLWREYASSQGWIAGYVQLAPSVELGEAAPGDELVTSNAVFLLDLSGADVLESASRIVRRKVRKAIEMGVELEHDQAVVADALTRLYPGAHRWRRAGPLYDFDRTTLERWALDPSSVALGARIGDSIEAVSVAYVSGRAAEYHLSASTQAGRQLDAWLLWHATRRLRARGVETLNLGGGVRPGDGIYEFKARFNGERRPLRALRQVYDQATYDDLCRQAGVSASDGWFPAYRASRRPGALDMRER